MDISSSRVRSSNINDSVHEALYKKAHQASNQESKIGTPNCDSLCVASQENLINSTKKGAYVRYQNSTPKSITFISKGCKGPRSSSADTSQPSVQRPSSSGFNGSLCSTQRAVTQASSKRIGRDARQQSDVTQQLAVRSSRSDTASRIHNNKIDARVRQLARTGAA